MGLGFRVGAPGPVSILGVGVNPGLGFWDRMSGFECPGSRVRGWGSGLGLMVGAQGQLWGGVSGVKGLGSNRQG